MAKAHPNKDRSASARIDDRLAELGDWRAETLRRMRKLIQQADLKIVEEWKRAKATSPGVPVWSAASEIGRRQLSLRCRLSHLGRPTF